MEDPSLSKGVRQIESNSKLNYHTMDSVRYGPTVNLDDDDDDGDDRLKSAIPLTNSAIADKTAIFQEKPTMPSCWGLWPPRKKFARYLIVAICSGLIWGILWSVTRKDAVPGGHLFALTMIIAACWISGEILGKFNLPALLGMLIMGFIIRNWPIPSLNIGIEFRSDWASALRSAALAIILTRAGLGLDAEKLKSMGWVCIRFTCLPCIADGLAAGAAAHWILGFPITMAFTLGFVLAGVSPAVLVPPMLQMQKEGIGVDKGIPTLGVLTAGVDPALAVAVFGSFLSITFSSGALWFTILGGPLGIVMGTAYGVTMGVITWYLPNKSSKSVVFPRFALIFLGNLFAIYVSKQINFAGAGAVGALIFSFVAGIGWRKDNNRDKEIARIFAVIWLFMQPIVFGLIGAEIALENINSDVLGRSIAVLFLGLTGRTIVGICCVLNSGFNWKEIVFMQSMCIPKATVQAAIGPLVLDAARTMNAGEETEKMGLLIIMIAAMSIIICAPLGAIAISLLAPRLLQKKLLSTTPQVEISAL